MKSNTKPDDRGFSFTDQQLETRFQGNQRFSSVKEVPSSSVLFDDDGPKQEKPKLPSVNSLTKLKAEQATKERRKSILPPMRIFAGQINQSEEFSPLRPGISAEGYPSVTAIQPSMFAMNAPSDNLKIEAKKSSNTSNKTFKRTGTIRNEDHLIVTGPFHDPKIDAGYSAMMEDENWKQTLKELTEEQLMQKALRNFKDALFFRRVRNDLDTPKYRWVVNIYNFQTSPLWNTFLFSVSWLLLGITFLEPSSLNDSEFTESSLADYYSALKGLEITIVALLWIDMILFLSHKLHETSKSYCKKLLGNPRIVVQFLFNLCILADLITFHFVFYPEIIFRYSRVIRPVAIFFYSREMCRTLDALLRSFKAIFEILFLFFFVSFIFAVFGIKLAKVPPAEASVHPQPFNYSNVYEFFNAMFILMSSAEGYPSILFPSLDVTLLAAIYYLPYMALSMLLLFPIPTAVLFNSFSYHRKKTVISDRLMEREALFSCFTALTIHLSDSGKLEEAHFLKFTKRLYPTLSESIFKTEIYDMIDINGDGSLELIEFFMVPELILNNVRIPSLKWPELSIWRRFRTAISSRLRLTTLLNSKLYKIWIILICLADIGIVLYDIFGPSNEPAVLFNEIQYVFLGILCLDSLMKLLESGIMGYFGSKLNTIDGLLYLIYIWRPLSLSFLRIYLETESLVQEHLKKMKMKRLAEKSKEGIQESEPKKRGWFLKIYHFFQDFVEREITLVQKISLCIPIVTKIASILIVTMFSFAIIGIEIYNSKALKEDVEVHAYISFRTPGTAFMLLLQVVSGQYWTDVYYNIIRSYNYPLIVSSLYFISFYTIAAIIILSLVRGLIWEVFLVVDADFEERKKLDVDSIGQLDDHRNPMAIYGANLPSDNSIIKKNASELIEFKSNSWLKSAFMSRSPITNTLRREGSAMLTRQMKDRAKSELTHKPAAFSEDSHIALKPQIEVTMATPTNPQELIINTPFKQTESPDVLTLRDKPTVNPFSAATETSTKEKDDKNKQCSQEWDFNDDAEPKNLSSFYRVFRLRNEILPKFRSNMATLDQRAPSDPDHNTEEFGILDSPGMRGSQIEQKGDTASYQYLSPNKISGGTVGIRSGDLFSNISNVKRIPGSSLLRSATLSQQLHSKTFKSSIMQSELKDNGALVKPSSSLKVQSFRKESMEVPSHKLPTLEFEIMTGEKEFYVKIFSLHPNYSEKKVAIENAKEIEQKLYELMEDDSGGETMAPTVAKTKKEIDQAKDALSKEKMMENKRKKILKTNIDQELLMRKAFLKSGEADELEKMENMYLKETFGKFYEQVRGDNKEKEVIESTQNNQNLILMNVSRILRFQTNSPLAYSRMLAIAEKVMNNKIIDKKSFMKIIFNAGDDKYFLFDTSKIAEDNVSFRIVKKGPWLYSDELFSNEGMLYRGKNIFTPLEERDQIAIDRLKEELDTTILRSQDKSVKLDLVSKKDMYIMGFKNSDFFAISQGLHREYSHVKYVDKRRAESATIKELYIMIFHQHTEKAKPKRKDVDEVGTRKEKRRSTKHFVLNFEENAQSPEAKDDEEEEKGQMTKDSIFEFAMDLKSMIWPYKTEMFEKLSHFYFQKKAKAAKLDLNVNLDNQGSFIVS